MCEYYIYIFIYFVEKAQLQVISFMDFSPVRLLRLLVGVFFVLLLHNRGSSVFNLKWQLNLTGAPFIDNDNKKAES